LPSPSSGSMVLRQAIAKVGSLKMTRKRQSMRRNRHFQLFWDLYRRAFADNPHFLGGYYPSGAMYDPYVNSFYAETFPNGQFGPLDDAHRTAYLRIIVY